MGMVSGCGPGGLGRGIVGAECDMLPQDEFQWYGTTCPVAAATERTQAREAPF